jgi:hypothetical protein
MGDQHSIIPSTELRAQWRKEAPQCRDSGISREDFLIDRTARWSADQERDAIEHWLITGSHGVFLACATPNLIADLRAARRSQLPPETVEIDGHTYRLVE